MKHWTNAEFVRFGKHGNSYHRNTLPTGLQHFWNHGIGRENRCKGKVKVNVDLYSTLSWTHL